MTWTVRADSLGSMVSVAEVYTLDGLGGWFRDSAA